MTASTLSHLPMAAGSALLAGLGRAGLWAVARYMRAPLANTGMLALATMTAMAGTNALYNQTAIHPAPLFAPGPVAPVPAERPEDLARVADPQPQTVSAPAADPAPLVQPVTSETTGSVVPTVPDAPVGNKDVFAVQKKLFEMKLFEGEIDGYYGPMTARAIRAFEERHGLTPQGALTPAVIEAILGADATGVLRAPAAQPVAAAPAAVRAADPIQTAAAAPIATPTPAPAPLSAGDQADVLIGPVASDNPIDAVVASATETIDSLIAAVGDRQTPAPPAQRPVPALPLLASPSSNTGAQAMPAPIAPAQTPATIPARESRAASATAEPSRQIVANASPQATRPAATSAAPPAAATNRELVSQVQRGLASLGFLHGAIDGEADEATARAIRNFEVYHNYKVTGQVSPALVDMLLAAGASI
ncbi:peptidoglycan-binding domain-containing protein [Devosia nitrariae]|uniref:Peptidoglycan binding-like domain-containing protein n=1 Tax=Devosia nitrariae TaxID=2071872 RepID=A0ABQ5W4X4_9HYPH|nr:peptidoglycan-binding domain-containing protein [Devosia nitrariae]GLQ55032.1 hypothetical protein GCM10010862_22910 [Devosia nitrariae]